MSWSVRIQARPAGPRRSMLSVNISGSVRLRPRRPVSSYSISTGSNIKHICSVSSVQLTSAGLPGVNATAVPGTVRTSSPPPALDRDFSGQRKIDVVIGDLIGDDPDVRAQPQVADRRAFDDDCVQSGVETRTPRLRVQPYRQEGGAQCLLGVVDIGRGHDAVFTKRLASTCCPCLPHASSVHCAAAGRRDANQSMVTSARGSGKWMTCLS